MIVRIYLIGVSFLTGVIAVNLIGSLLKLPSWYDFLANPELTPLSFVWLFVVYPFILGLLFFWLKRFIKK
jgi:hypothetical protein